MLQTKPVKHPVGANYPTHGQMVENPRLANLTPNRWAANPRVLAAFAVASATMQTGWTSEHSVTPGIMPPQYMTESDAVDIAKEQAKLAGLSFKLNSKKIPLTVMTPEGKKKKVDFVLDLIDEKTGVGFECLSLFDCYDVYGYETKVTPKQLAITIQANLSKADRAKIKVVAESGRTSKAGPKKEQEALKTELRSFFKWLKAQGVI